MDTGSSAAAASLCGRCRGLSRKIDVELGVVLQVPTSLIFDNMLLTACPSSSHPRTLEVLRYKVILVRLVPANIDT